MSKRILWIDNDRVFLRPHILRLEVEEYSLKQVLTLTEGIEEVTNNGYDLLILDMMMPVKEEEEALFPPRDTNSGTKSGMVFYKKYKGKLEEKHISVFVFTIREERSIREECLAAGLPAENFMTKSEGADTAVFLAKVKRVLGEESDEVAAEGTK